MTTPTAHTIEQKLKKLSSAEKKKASEWFFKTGKGQYGYGDVFYGVTVPEQRKVAKEYKDLPLSETKKLLESPVHECRLTALLILVHQYTKSDPKTKKKIADFYLKNIAQINNWDLVDSTARYILGNYLIDRDRKILYTLARSNNIWKRRVAIIATHEFINNDDFVDTIAISELLLGDSEDLIHKAVGWMLREMGNRCEKELKDFLEIHAATMPRTTLRYAIEKLSDRDKKRYMKMKSTLKE